MRFFNILLAAASMVSLAIAQPATLAFTSAPSAPLGVTAGVPVVITYSGGGGLVSALFPYPQESTHVFLACHYQPVEGRPD